MHTIKEHPWIPYMSIDEETNEHVLKENAPEDVKKAYDAHLREIRKYIDANELMPK